MMLLVDPAVNGGVVVVYQYGSRLPILSTNTIVHGGWSEMTGISIALSRRDIQITTTACVHGFPETRTVLARAGKAS
jgi:hypothetical protein